MFWGFNSIGFNLCGVCFVDCLGFGGCMCWIPLRLLCVWFCMSYGCWLGFAFGLPCVGILSLGFAAGVGWVCSFSFGVLCGLLVDW